MSYPILYSATETDFDNNGLGILGDCASCEVTEEANGAFELTIAYPMDGIHFKEISDRGIIKTKVDQFRNPQLFRIYAISKPMSGIVTVLAQHISYDLSGIPVKPFSSTSVSDALSGLKINSVVDCPFTFWTDKTTSANFLVETPSSIRSRLGGASGSILDIYGGEYEFDNYTVKLHKNRGENRGVSIRYGKNLTDINQEQNCSSVATGIYPYWFGEVAGTHVLVELPERVVNAPGTYDFVKVKTVDFTNDFEERPSIEQLRQKAETYVEKNKIGVPVVSLSVSFAQLEQTEEYKHLNILERVGLFDTVNIEFPALGVHAEAKVVKTVYDVLSERIKLVSLGSAKTNIADTIVGQSNKINKSPTKGDIERAKSSSSAELASYAKEIEKSISDLQAQVDGQVQSWFYDYLPTTTNPPASEWVTKEQKDAHLGDLFYVVDNEEYNGMVYRWVFVNGSYKWSIVEDTQVSEALAAASRAQDTADGKRRVFITTPKPPYDAGDLWAQGSGGDLMVCKTSRASGSYSAADWGLASDYIDATKAGTISQSAADTAETNAKKYADSAAQAAVSAQTQKDIFDKLTNNGSLEGIYMQDGKLYINASYLKGGTVSANIIDVANLVAQKLKSVSGDSAVIVEDGVLFLTQNNQFSVILSNGGDGTPALSMADNVLSNGRSMLTPYKLQLGGTSTAPTFRIDCVSGSPVLKYGDIEGALLGDHIVDSGWSINFSYIKYASGYAVGWGQSQFENIDITTPFGSLYESEAMTVTFSHFVSGAPYWCDLSILDASLGVMLEVRDSVTPTTSQTFFLVRGKSATGVDAIIGYRVAWYWK